MSHKFIKMTLAEFCDSLLHFHVSQPRFQWNGVFRTKLFSSEKELLQMCWKMSKTFLRSVTGKAPGFSMMSPSGHFSPACLLPLPPRISPCFFICHILMLENDEERLPLEEGKPRFSLSLPFSLSQFLCSLQHHVPSELNSWPSSAPTATPMPCRFYSVHCSVPCRALSTLGLGLIFPLLQTSTCGPLIWAQLSWSHLCWFSVSPTLGPWTLCLLLWASP